MARISVANLISRPQETSSIETPIDQCLNIGENASGKS